MPSLVKDWHHEIKDRQLLLAVDAFISKTVGPMVVSQELEVLQSLKASQTMQNYTVTVQRSVTGSEVYARY